MQLVEVAAEGRGIGYFQNISIAMAIDDMIKHAKDCGFDPSEIQVHCPSNSKRARINFPSLVNQDGMRNKFLAKYARIGDVHADHPYTYVLIERTIETESGYYMTGEYSD